MNIISLTQSATPRGYTRAVAVGTETVGTNGAPTGPNSAVSASFSNVPSLDSAAIPFNSMMDALLNAQSRTAPLVFGPDGKPDLHQTIIAGLLSARSAAAGLTSIQVLTKADDGSSDPVNLANYSSDDVAENLISQVGSAGALTLTDVLDKMGVNTDTVAGKAVAKGIGEAWTRLNHGQSGPLSKADLTAAIQSYRASHGDAIGDAISGGGMAWTG